MKTVESFESVTSHLKLGGLIVYPTETLWGLGVDGTNEEAVNQLFLAKGRSLEKAVSVLVPHSLQAGRVAYVCPKAQRLMKNFWPGPLTLVLPIKEKRLYPVIGNTNKIGLRCPSYFPLRKWLYSLDFWLTTTSANRSGESNAKSYIDFHWLPQETILVEGPFYNSRGSTVVSVENDQCKLLREGDLPWSVIQDSLL